MSLQTKLIDSTLTERLLLRCFLEGDILCASEERILDCFLRRFEDSFGETCGDSE